MLCTTRSVRFPLRTLCSLSTSRTSKAAVHIPYHAHFSSTSDTYRVHNFSAGPSCLPLDVLKEAQAEMLSLEGSGMSFMEMSHRDVNGPVQNAISSASQLVKDLLAVPDNYHVLFMHGGAHGQFAGIL